MKNQALCCLLLLATSACKDGKDSQVNTLDNLANSDQTLVKNQCQADGLPSFVHQAAKNLAFPNATVRQAFLTAIAAVPERVQKRFFDAPNYGTVEFKASLTDACVPEAFREVVAKEQAANDFFSEEGRLGCWLRTPRPTIRLVTDERSIRYATVRMFGFAWAELSSNMVIPADKDEKPSVVWEGAPDFQQFKADLALAFLYDLDQKGNNKTLQAFKAFGLSKALLTSRSDRGPAAYLGRRAEWKKQAWPLANEFANRVAAEAFHSYFCRQETRQTMDEEKGSYPTVGSLFVTQFPELPSSANSHALALTNGKNRISAARCDYDCQSAARLAKFSRQDYEKAHASFFQNLKSKSAQASGRNDEAKLQLAGGLLGSLFSSLFGGFVQNPNSYSNNSYYPSSFGPSYTNAYGNNNDYASPNSQQAYNASQAGWNGTPSPYNSGAYNNGGNGTGTIPSGTMSSEELAVVQKTNELRIQQGLQPLRADDTLGTRCRGQAQRQLSGGMNHYLEPNPENAGENIASGQISVDMVVNDWYNSPGHRANMLNPSYTSLGVGRVNNEWCQRFR